MVDVVITFIDREKPAPAAIVKVNPDGVMVIFDPAAKFTAPVIPFTEFTTFPLMFPRTESVAPDGIVVSEDRVAPAAEIPALNLTSELKVAPAALIPPGKFVRGLKVFIPVNVCVPASPARVVVKSGKVTLFGGLVGENKIS